MSAVNITSRCRGCGLIIELHGDTATQTIQAIDAAHDILKPNCPETTKRAAAKRVTRLGGSELVDPSAEGGR